MRRFGLITIGAVVGGLLVYLFDPDRGRSRRARLSDQAAARGRDLTESMKKTVEYQKGKARGVVHDVSKTFGPEENYDDETLIQKVKSEALGYWQDSGEIEIDITDGTVRVTGSVSDSSSRDRLIGLIRDVDGVEMIDDRLTVGA